MGCSNHEKGDEKCGAKEGGCQARAGVKVRWHFKWIVVLGCRTTERWKLGRVDQIKRTASKINEIMTEAEAMSEKSLIKGVNMF